MKTKNKKSYGMIEFLQEAYTHKKINKNSHHVQYIRLFFSNSKT